MADGFRRLSVGRGGPNPGAVFAGSFLQILSQLLAARRDREREEKEKTQAQRGQMREQAASDVGTVSQNVALAQNLPQLDAAEAQLRSSPASLPAMGGTTSVPGIGPVPTMTPRPGAQAVTQQIEGKRQQLTDEQVRDMLARAQQFVDQGEDTAGALELVGQPEAGQEGVGIGQEQIGRLAQREGRRESGERVAAEKEATREQREARRLELAEAAESRAQSGEARAAASFELTQEAQRLSNEINRIRLDALGNPDPEDPATPADAARVLGFVFQANDDARNTVIEMSRDPEGLRELAGEAGVEIPSEGFLGMGEGEPRFDKLVEHVRDKILEDAGVSPEVRQSATRILAQSLGGLQTGGEPIPEPPAGGEPAGGDGFQLALTNAQRMLQSQPLEQVIQMLQQDEALAAAIGAQNVQRIIATLRGGQ